MKTLFYHAFFAVFSYANYLMCKFRYRKPAIPYRLIQVNPFDIRRANENSRWVKMRLYYASGLIKRGKWDKPKQKLQPRHQMLFDCFQEIFHEGKEALTTDYFKHKLKTDSRERTEELANEYLERYRPIFQSFRSNSFKIPENPLDPRVEYFSIAIDENGTFLFLTGKHRLALAKAAGLETIPVNVAYRHKKWQLYRDQLYQGLVKGELQPDEIIAMNHPDLLDLLPKKFKH